ncbi:pentatricopeptide repeat-containing protein At2g30100, chloroplastic [Beta vulgaris subsp. vulgaris]|uniref:pentatricopeptide repeat-containing protein At2g30100, chloroplastic n=1 Tax=Beta vulgaris subsp. vulgaris TaxID=3555 RepID=UPI002036F64A|nr:pentatricopeptide repeat-containing protein At2g30100, chloroplastic [Beta vulgaris subsp. vulgaris]XP_010685932.2 pentatricopeptide repeat-containing protein At2g30100, chloroplastic [Beta vulgaris subsp. vulgaris]XP_019106584.2 pentatricopeptide repeat-containing protein At2g30100, chloroplastic [Beta vulgaris subsp. vulgaris]
MVASIGFAPLNYGVEASYTRCQDFVGFRHLRIEACSRVSITPTGDKMLKSLVPIRSKTREFRLFNSVELDRVLTNGDEDEMSEGFFEAIEELERMTREPSDVLEEMNDRLSARELQLVLVYFSQEGRDSWCALEVFEWLKKENRVDKETMELMVSIMCGWVKNMIEAEKEVGEVVDLLVDMDCVGLKPNFSMMEKAISVYWNLGKKDQAISFVEEVLRRGIMSVEDGVDDIHRGGPAGYLAWKMMEKGDYRDAVKLVIHLRESGLNPETYSYLVAMTAVVKELNEVSKALRKLKGFTKAGVVAELDEENIRLVEKYQSDLLDEGIQLSSWLIQEGNASVLSLVHEKLLAMYICAGRGLEAERQLLEMKLLGKEVERYFYDIVLAICASQRKDEAVSRLLTTLEATSPSSKKKTLSWLLRGYIKGGNFEDAAKTLTRMLDSGLHPDHLDRIAVVQGLRRMIPQHRNMEIYLRLCKRLSDAELIGPCLVYMYIKKYRLWIIKMV